MSLDQAVTDVEFVVVDLETTGSVPGKDGITEIAAVKVKNGKVVDTFESLVNPERDIPPFIQELTGITPDMVADAPLIGDVMPQFWEFLGTGVFVAHYAPFDYGFLNHTTKTLLGEPLENPRLCTCRLARKLLPDLRRKNLDTVCEHYGIANEARHRAFGDAKATAEVLQHFLAMLAEDGKETLAQVLEYEKKGPKRYKDITIPFPAHRIDAMPTTPGVYLMRDERGEILYIGKAKNLKRRLQSYFTGLRRQPGKVVELMQQVMDIEVKVLGSELEALLEEAYLIKAHQPYFNRQIKHYQSFPFLKITVNEAIPKILITTEIDNDNALYFGPYKGKRRLKVLVDILTRVFQLRDCSDKEFKKCKKKNTPCMAYDVGRCSGPCVGHVSRDDYRQQVQQIVDFLEGRVSDVMEQLIAKRDAYTEAMAYEKAQQIQESVLDILKVQANTQYLAQAMHHHHLLINLPHTEPHRRLLLYVFKGRPLDKQIFDPTQDSIEGVLERVAMIQDMLALGSEEKSEVIQKQELEEIRIIAHWLKYHQPESEAVLWDLTEPRETLNKAIVQHFQCQPMV